MNSRTYFFYALLLYISLSATACFRYRINDSNAHREFDRLGYNFQIHRYKIGKKTIRYFEIGRDSLPVVVFIHGGLGTATTYKPYMKDSVLLQRYKMFIPDRYGHGFSDFGHTETSLEKQAALLKPMMEAARATGEKVILVGHSYGGTVAARLVMDYPGIADYLILSAPAIDPDHEKRFWFNQPLDFWAVKWFIPKNWNIANDEKLAHAAECKKMANLWAKITIPTTYIHGRNDEIVPFDNYAFAKRKLVNAPVRFIIKDNLSHCSVTEQPEVIRNIIMSINNRAIASNPIAKTENKGANGK